jgi:hypothetical protein
MFCNSATPQPKIAVVVALGLVRSGFDYENEDDEEDDKVRAA